jgi:hypothetical protein
MTRAEDEKIPVIAQYGYLIMPTAIDHVDICATTAFIRMQTRQVESLSGPLRMPRFNAIAG